VDAPGLDVSLRPIRPPGRRDRGPLAAAALALTVLGMVGVALLGRPEDRPPPDRTDAAAASPVARTPAARTPAARTPAARTPAARTPAPRRAATPPVRPSPIPTPVLPDLPNEALPGAPLVALVSRAGNAADIFAWRAGEPDLGPAIPVTGAFSPVTAAESSWTDLSPDGSRLLVGWFTFPNGQEPTQSLRVLDVDGRLLLERRGLPVAAEPVWAVDGSALVHSSASEWFLVEFGPGGGTSEVAIRVAPAGAATPSPAIPDAPPDSPFAIPVGFSADGRWLFGARRVAGAPYFLPALRVDRRNPDAPPVAIDRYPVRGPGRIVPSGSVGGLIDPATGRLLDGGVGGADVVVYGPDGSVSLRTAVPGLPAIAGAAWVGAGRLLVIAADRLDRPSRVEARVVTDDGGLRAPLLETGPLNRVTLLAARSGYVLLAMVGRSSPLLVLLRAGDGATSRLFLPRDRVGALNGIDLVERAPGAAR